MIKILQIMILVAPEQYDMKSPDETPLIEPFLLCIRKPGNELHVAVKALLKETKLNPIIFINCKPIMVTEMLFFVLGEKSFLRILFSSTTEPNIKNSRWVSIVIWTRRMLPTVMPHLLKEYIPSINTLVLKAVMLDYYILLDTTVKLPLFSTQRILLVWTKIAIFGLLKWGIYSNEHIYANLICQNNHFSDMPKCGRIGLFYFVMISKCWTFNVNYVDGDCSKFTVVILHVTHAMSIQIQKCSDTFHDPGNWSMLSLKVTKCIGMP